MKAFIMAVKACIMASAMAFMKAFMRALIMALKACIMASVVASRKAFVWAFIVAFIKALIRKKGARGLNNPDLGLLNPPYRK